MKKLLLLALVVWPAVVQAGTVNCTNNSSSDPGAISVAIGSGNVTVTLVGTCSLGTTSIQVPANTSIQGSGSNGNSGPGANTNTVLNYTGTAYAFNVNGNNVSILGVTMNGGGILTTQSSTTTPQQALTFNNLTIQQITSGANGFEAFGYWSNVSIQHDVLSFIANPSWAALDGSHFCEGGGRSQNPVPAGIGIDSANGQENVLIQYNSFDHIACDGMHIQWNWTLGAAAGTYHGAGGNSLSYNAFNFIHRMAIEAQGTTSNCVGGCSYGFASGIGLKVAGNDINNVYYPYFDLMGLSIPVGAGGAQYLNNTIRYGNIQATWNCSGDSSYGIEDSGDNTNTQGNFIASSSYCSPNGWGPPIEWGSTSSGHTSYAQNNVLCGPNYSSHASQHLGPFSYEGTQGGPIVNQYNWTYATAGSPNTCPGDPTFPTAIAGAFTSANNQTFSSGGNGTWSLYVTNNAAIRWVNFYLDGGTTPVATQELQDLNTNFANDRKWLYHATLNTGTLSSGSHTITAAATDTTGTAVTIGSQNFTVGSGGAPTATVSPTSLNFIAAGSLPATLSNNGTAALTISGATITGANAGDFSYTTTCGSSLAASSSCTYTVTFSPAGSGLRTASLQIGNNSTNNPATVSLQGTTFGSQCTIPGPCTVQAGQSIEIISPSNSTWSLVSGSIGTLTTVDATHAVYTAPSTVDEARAAVGGCLIQPNDSVFTTRIDALPVHASSSAWISNLGASTFTWVPGWDANVVDSTVNTNPAPLYYYTPSYNTLPEIVPNTASRKRESGAIADYTEIDHHLVAVRHDTCVIQELYQDATQIGNVAGPNHALGCSQLANQSQGCDAVSAWQYSGYSYTLPTGGSTDGAALPLEPLTLRAPEVRTGAITHALRFTTNSAECQNTKLWPSSGADSNCSPNANALPAGARLRLKASYSCPSSGAAAVVCTALKQYGLMWADITAGPNPQIVTDTASWYDPYLQGVFNTLAIPSSNFEAVDESSLMVSAGSSAAKPNNGYVTPSNSALVSTGSTFQPVAIAPITVGVSEPYVAMPSGGTFQPVAWVNGPANTNVSWTASGGSFSGGTYTAPTLAAGANTLVTLTGCSVADSHACASIYVSVLASKCKSADSTLRICIDSGATTSYGPDANGDTWAPDSIVTGGTYGAVSNTAGWQFQTDGQLFETWLVNQYDLSYRFVGMPAGNYKITIGQGIGYANDGTSYCNFGVGWPSTYRQYPTPFGLGPAYTIAQGQIVSYYMDPSLPPISNGAACFQRSFYTMPVTVASDGKLQFGLDGLGNNQMAAQVNTTLATVKVEADTSAPHLAIDLLGQTDVVYPAGTKQLNVAWWYLPSTAVTWQLVSGPGTLSATGLYTAPVSQAVTAPAVITATDTAGHCVTQILWVQGSSALGLLN